MSRTDEIHARILEKAAERDLSPRAVSLAATRQPDAITAIRRGHMPNPDRLRAIADVLEVDSEWLLTGEDSPAPRLADPRVLFRHRDFTRDVPIFGTALGADLQINGNGHAEPIEVTNVEMAEMIGYLNRPPGLIGNRKAYALYVVGSSMEPRFDPGQPVFVDAGRPPAIGDDVIVQLIDDTDGRVVTALIKRLVRRTSAFVELRQYNPDQTFRIEMTRIASVQRVLSVSELLGL